MCSQKRSKTTCQGRSGAMEDKVKLKIEDIVHSDEGCKQKKSGASQGMPGRRENLLVN